MSKSLYSLILSDEVVARIDRMAVREQTNRSALVNRILAEYCSMMTPEKRIESVFAAVGAAFGGDGELAAFLTPNAPTMFLKTSLEYRYRPTVRYDLRLYPAAEADGTVGELTVAFRTQSEELLARIDGFFRAWIAGERTADGAPPGYALTSGRLIRTIRLPAEEASPEEFAGRIAEYVRVFDEAMKAAVAGRAEPEALARAARTAGRLI